MGKMFFLIEILIKIPTEHEMFVSKVTDTKKAKINLHIHGFTTQLKPNQI